MTALAGIALLPLAACAVETSEGPAEPNTAETDGVETDGVGADAAEDAPEETDSAEDAPEETDSAEEAPDADDQADDVDSGATDILEEIAGAQTIELRLSREDAIAAATRQVNCSGGILDFDTMGFVTHITDDCESVTVSGSAAMLIVENVETLILTGVGNTVYVKDVSSIEIAENADINAVIYEGPAPFLDDASVGSMVVHVSQTVVVD